MYLNPFGRSFLTRRPDGPAERGDKSAGSEQDTRSEFPDGERPPRSLLASRWFWLGGILSLAVWAALIWLVWKVI